MADEGALVGRAVIERVLVVDPAGLMAPRLAEAGCDIRRVASGAEALQYLRVNAVGCIAVDWDELADARRLLRDVRRLGVAIPVIAASRSALTDLVVEVMKAGASDFVVLNDDWIPGFVLKMRSVVQAGRDRVTADHVVRPSFVGREQELGILDAELARAVAGEGRVALLTGDEGIGKTSLVVELIRLARARGCTTLRGACPEVGDAPAYWPWIQILRAYGKSVGADTLAEDVGESAAAVAWIAPTLRLPVALASSEGSALTRFQLIDGISQFLRRVAARRPLVLVLDDLHRADADSACLFRSFAADCSDLPVLMVGAHRDMTAATVVADDLSRIASMPATTVLRLGRFDAEAVRRYVEQATRTRPSPRIVEAIFAKTGGHPLFVAEVTRLLATDGRLSGPAASGELRLTMPATRRHAIAARLGRLSAGCRELLDVAAVVGHDFAAELLAPVTGLDERVVRERLGEAIDDQLVAPSDEDPEVLRFAHVLVRDVLYEALGEEVRRALHARIADALELSAAERWTAFGGEPPLAAIAHHCREGATTRAEHQRALQAVVAAAERAAAGFAYEEAARHYEGALQLAEQHCLVRPPVPLLLVRLADAHRRAGDAKKARAVGRRALTLADASGDAERIATAALAFAGDLPRFGALGSAPEVTEELERALRALSTDATELRARLMARLAEELVQGGSPNAPTLARRAIELARGTGDPAVLASVLRTLHSALWTPDDIEWRPALAAEIVALAGRIGDRVLGLNGQLLSLWSALEHGDVALASRQLGVCRRLAAELRLPHFDWVTAAARVCLSITRGRFDEAEALVDEIFAGLGRSPTPSMLLVLGVQREHVRFLRGRTDDLGDWYHFVLQNFPSLAPMVECAMVCHDAWLGRDERARDRLTALVTEECVDIPRNGTWMMNMVYLADAALRLEDRRAARPLHTALAPFAAYNAMLAPCYVFAPVAHYLAGLEGLLGDDASARRHHEEALTIAERMGSGHWVARIRIAYGAFLRRAGAGGDAERGNELVASGHALAESLDARWLIREADVSGATAPPPRVERTRFRQVAHDWEIEFRGACATVPQRAGIAYLRCLLERPGVPVPAVELASLGREGILVDGGGGRAADGRALADVRRRLAEIEAEIAACARRNASVDAALRHEQHECARYLARRGAQMIGAADRARSGVTKAISRAIVAIGRAHPTLGHHLARHVETGRLCRYVEDPGVPIVFEF